MDISEGHRGDRLWLPSFGDAVRVSLSRVSHLVLHCFVKRLLFTLSRATFNLWSKWYATSMRS